MFRALRSLYVLTPLLLATPALVIAQVPAAPVLQASANGQTVSASWTAVPGATGYRVEAGVSPAMMLAGYEMGPLTNFSIQAPQGTFYLRVLARNGSGVSAPSNVVGIAVQSSVPPPPPPTGLSVSVNGSSVTFSAQLPNVPLTGLLLVAGMTPGAAQVVVPLSVSAQNTVNNVPPGVYYGRLVAVNAGGNSPPSNEVQIVVTAVTCTAPAVPTLSAQVNGVGVVLSWSAVPGAVGYRLTAATAPGGAPILAQDLGAGTTAVANPNTPPGTYYVRVTAANACGLQSTSAETTVTVTPPPPGTSPRTPNPPPGQQLPLPNRAAVATEIARLYPADLRNSCITAPGGNNTWLFRLVQRLRQEDSRWGLNWKRGRVGDMSQDIVTYNWGSEADEGTRQIYVLDVIGGHCGTNPSDAWINQTGVGGADAIWTLQPYTQAGFPR